MPDANTAQPAAGFDSLQSIEQFQAANRHIFPTLPSFRWFYRKHRAELIEAGAIVELTGRLFVRPPMFVKMALRIGSTVAAARCEHTTSTLAAQAEIRKA